MIYRHPLTKHSDGCLCVRCEDPGVVVSSADARALADIHTLDEYNPNWSMTLAPNGGVYCMPHGTGSALALYGATPAEARAAAAKWIGDNAK